MQIGVCSIFVDDQEHAARFYTDVLGFVTKTDIPMGDFSWLTVVSPDTPDGVEMLLEPNSHPAARAYQESIYGDGIPATMFFVSDMEAEYDRLTKRGVEFTTPPTATEQMTFAVFDDTCGNLIQLVER